MLGCLLLLTCLRLAVRLGALPSPGLAPCLLASCGHLASGRCRQRARLPAAASPVRHRWDPVRRAAVAAATLRHEPAPPPPLATLLNWPPLLPHVWTGKQ